MANLIPLPTAKSTILFAAVVALLGCSRRVDRSDLASLASTREFGFRLFAQLASDSAPENVVISPVAVEMCLAMAANGAGGKTQAEIVTALGCGLDSINQANAALLRSLPVSRGPVKLTLANSLWGREGLEFTKQFLSLCGRDYSATARTLDFASPSAAREINNWAARKTKGLIPNIVDNLRPTDVALLLSAVYFHGKWARPFSPGYTHAHRFHLIDGKQVERKMMYHYEEFGCLQTDSFSAVALPFVNRRFCMYVFVPDDTLGLPKFLKKLNDDNWRKWTAEFETAEIVVGLPRFTIEYAASLKGPLSALGIESAFDSRHADFKHMVAESSLQPVWFGDARHKAHIEVDEAGARAVAVMALSAVGGAPSEVVADHPFFLAITDTWSGAILFMGAVYDPPQ
jgi:serine protease inhibitor